MKKILLPVLIAISLSACSHTGFKQHKAGHHAQKVNTDKCEYGGEFYSKGAVIEMAGVKKECRINGNAYPTWESGFIN